MPRGDRRLVRGVRPMTRVRRVTVWVSCGLAALSAPPACFAWQDQQVSAGSRIRSQHLQELIQQVNAVRLASGCGLGAMTTIQPADVAVGQPIRASHLNVLRDGICEVYTVAGQACSVPWGGNVPLSAGAAIRAQHILDLRSAVDNAPRCSVCGNFICEPPAEDCNSCFSDCSAGCPWQCSGPPMWMCSQTPGGTFPDLGSCQAGCAAGCTCSDGACGSGGCNATERPRSCNPPGCQPEGCFPDPIGCSAGGCTPGATQPCATGGGCPGQQTCQADRTWGACAQTNPVCVPAATQSCVDGGCTGTKTCNACGTAWQACVTAGLPDGTTCGESDPEVGQCCPECNPDPGRCDQCCNGSHVVPNAGSQICRSSQSDLLVCGPGGGPPPCVDVTCYRCPIAGSGGIEQQAFCTDGGLCPAGWVNDPNGLGGCPCLNDLCCCGSVGCLWNTETGQCNAPCLCP